MTPLYSFLDSLIKTGTLIYEDSSGRSREFKGINPGPCIKIISKDKMLEWKLLLNPELALPEAYMSGRLQIESDGEPVYSKPLLQLLQSNVDKFTFDYNFGMLKAFKQPVQFLKTINSKVLASKRVRHHYDVGNNFYKSWLDTDMMYSCAYFDEEGISLEEAQERKKEHLRKKLDLRKGDRVLDIGCGWGGMALHLAQKADVRVVGVSLSPEQLKIANERAKNLGLSERVEFRLCDYRDINEKFDKIISIGMLEHVGKSNIKLYFQRISDLLSKDGLAVIHTISTKNTKSDAGPFIRKYIFPGGYIPTLAELTDSVAKVGLWPQDVEIWRLHYAKTLDIWRQRFLENKSEVIDEFDEKFFRMWEYYLAGCETFFSHGAGIVAQFQLGHLRDAAPLSRDYICNGKNS